LFVRAEFFEFLLKNSRWQRFKGGSKITLFISKIQKVRFFKSLSTFRSTKGY
jgi:hypothetical protein